MEIRTPCHCRTGHGEYIKLVSTLSHPGRKTIVTLYQKQAQNKSIATKSNVGKTIQQKERRCGCDGKNPEHDAKHRLQPRTRKINNDIFQYAQDGQLDLVKMALRNGCDATALVSLIQIE